MEPLNKYTGQTTDIVVLTDRRYIEPEETNDYINNVLLEDRIVAEAMAARGLRVCRRSWDDPDFDWTTAQVLLFRTTWDYFDRFKEFEPWLQKVSSQCKLINPPEILYWNIDKHYLGDLYRKGINIPPTEFLEKGNPVDLGAVISKHHWKEAVVKPCISGAGRHTYRIGQEPSKEVQDIVTALLQDESMMLQEFQNSILTEGEVSLMIVGNTFTHAVLKRARSGEFRVQDDFGGTVAPYEPKQEEIEFALSCIAAAPCDPDYARVDIFRDNNGKLCLAELELIEPEMWFRHSTEAARILADTLCRKYFSEE